MDFLSLSVFFLILLRSSVFCRSAVLDWPLQGYINQLTFIQIMFLFCFVFPNLGTRHCFHWTVCLCSYQMCQPWAVHFLDISQMQKDLASSRSNINFMTTLKYQHIEC